MADAGYSVEFGRTTCSIVKGEVKTKLGYRNGGLYQLIQNTTPPTIRFQQGKTANLGLVSNKSPSTTLETWHRRLGHRSLDQKPLQYLSSKVPDITVSEPDSIASKLCGICARGSQHSEAETGTREKVTELLQAIHTDVCGPMQTLTLTGERYFVAFTDEMSGRVSISLLSSKDGALA